MVHFIQETLFLSQEMSFIQTSTQKELILLKDWIKNKYYLMKKLKKLGMYSLLSVGMGSVRGSYLVTMEWNGGKSKTKPLAFVGKGVTFDTGGYSLKPARFIGGYDL